MVGFFRWRPSEKLHKPIRRIGFSISAIFFALCIIEIILHFVLGNIAVLELFQVHEGDPPFIDLRPDFEVTHTGLIMKSTPIRYRINKNGFRGKEYSKDPPKNVFRIIALGDSNTFGFGVSEGQDYPSRLEYHLNQASNTPIEVLNFGIISLNMNDILFRLKTKAMSFKPDLVLVQIEDNDYDPPAYQNLRFLNSFSVWTLRHIYLSRPIFYFVIKPNDSGIQRLSEQEQERVFKKFVRELDVLRRTQNVDIRIIKFITRGENSVIFEKKWADSLKIPFWIFPDELNKYLKAEGLHLDAKGNDILAQDLVKWLDLPLH